MDSAKASRWINIDRQSGKECHVVDAYAQFTGAWLHDVRFNGPKQSSLLVINLARSH